MTANTKHTETLTRYLSDTEKHVFTVLAEGPVTHLRYARPGSSFDFVEVVAWPGNLVVSGDMGTYAFQRESDMLAFFRKPLGKINPSYWAEKLEAADRRCGYESFSRAKMIEHFTDAAREHAEDEGWPDEARDALLADLRDFWPDDYGNHQESLDYLQRTFTVIHGATRYEHRPDTDEASESAFSVYVTQYLWSLHAIVHLIGLYDAFRAERASQDAADRAAAARIHYAIRGS